MRFVIGISGGKIQDARQVSFLLLGIAVALLVLALFIFWPRETLRIPTAEDIRLQPHYNTVPNKVF